MIKFLFALFFGAGQIFLTERLIYTFNKKEGKKALLVFAAKFIAYAIGISLVLTKDILNINLFLCGFLVGVPVTAIALFVYNTIYKK